MISPPPHPRRIVIIGSPCSGKSRLALQVSRHLGAPHVELDALYWEPGWVEADADVFRSRIEQAIATGRWVVDGNYGAEARDIVWVQADTIVWLDYRLTVVLARFMRRSIPRILRRQKLWNGNVETVRGALIGRDSLLWFTLRTYRRRRRQYASLMQHETYAGATWLRLRTPRATGRWLATLPAHGLN